MVGFQAEPGWQNTTTTLLINEDRLLPVGPQRKRLLITCAFPHPPSQYIQTSRLVTLETDWGHLRRGSRSVTTLDSFVTVCFVDARVLFWIIILSIVEMAP